MSSDTLPRRGSAPPGLLIKSTASSGGGPSYARAAGLSGRRGSVQVNLNELLHGLSQVKDSQPAVTETVLPSKSSTSTHTTVPEKPKPRRIRQRNRFPNAILRQSEQALKQVIAGAPLTSVLAPERTRSELDKLFPPVRLPRDLNGNPCLPDIETAFRRTKKYTRLHSSPHQHAQPTPIDSPAQSGMFKRRVSKVMGIMSLMKGRRSSSGSLSQTIEKANAESDVESVSTGRRPSIALRESLAPSPTSTPVVTEYGEVTDAVLSRGGHKGEELLQVFNSAVLSEISTEDWQKVETWHSEFQKLQDTLGDGLHASLRDREASRNDAATSGYILEQAGLATIEDVEGLENNSDEFGRRPLPSSPQQRDISPFMQRRSNKSALEGLFSLTGTVRHRTPSPARRSPVRRRKHRTIDLTPTSLWPTAIKHKPSASIESRQKFYRQMVEVLDKDGGVGSVREERVYELLKDEMEKGEPVDSSLFWTIAHGLSSNELCDHGVIFILHQASVRLGVGMHVFVHWLVTKGIQRDDMPLFLGQSEATSSPTPVPQRSSEIRRPKGLADSLMSEVRGRSASMGDGSMAKRLVRR